MTTRPIPEFQQGADPDELLARGERIEWIDPERAYAALRCRPFPFWLDSALIDERLGGRWSYVGADPVERVALDGSGWRAWHGDVERREPDTRSLDALLRGLGLSAGLGEPLGGGRDPKPDPHCPAPFQGGLVGYLGYEFASLLERSLPEPDRSRAAFPDLWLGHYPAILAFDHRLHEAWLIAAPAPGCGGRQLAERVAALRERLDMARGRSLPPPDLDLRDVEPRSNFTVAGFEAAVARTVEYVLAGDIFQANIAQRFTVARPEGLDALALYRRLRRASPAPFGALLELRPDLAILSASPERFLQVGPERVETRPIKGTRPRGATAEVDAAAATELLGSAKDRAENVMIVDLLRNDLAKTCAPGTITVEALCELQSFRQVHHLVSRITGVPAQPPFDVLLHAFPGGSVTGAPKIRAMEIIRELEPHRRGPYCGTFLWAGRGRLDSSILIRTLLLDGDELQFHAGGGITASSEPAAEYAETLAKAEALLSALRGPRC